MRRNLSFYRTSFLLIAAVLLSSCGFNPGLAGKWVNTDPQAVKGCLSTVPATLDFDNKNMVVTMSYGTPDGSFLGVCGLDSGSYPYTSTSNTVTIRGAVLYYKLNGNELEVGGGPTLSDKSTFKRQ